MTRQIRFSRQIERFRAALKSKSTVCTKNKIMHFLQSQDSTSSHLQLFGRVSSLSSQLILHFGKTNDWESKWLNIVVSPVCNRHMRREVCQSFVHCWCPSISTATSRHHSKQHTSYAIAVCSYTYLLWRGYPQKKFYIAQMALCSLKLSKMDKNNHKGQKWSPKRGAENYVINFLRTHSTQQERLIQPRAGRGGYFVQHEYGVVLIFPGYSRYDKRLHQLLTYHIYLHFNSYFSISAFFMVAGLIREWALFFVICISLVLVNHLQFAWAGL